MRREATARDLQNLHRTLSNAIERYGKFAQSNADSLWAGYPDGVFGLDWSGGPYTPDPTFWIAGTLQTSALDCFNCATRTQ